MKRQRQRAESAGQHRKKKTKEPSAADALLEMLRQHAEAEPAPTELRRKKKKKKKAALQLQPHDAAEEPGASVQTTAAALHLAALMRATAVAPQEKPQKKKKKKKRIATSAAAAAHAQAGGDQAEDAPVKKPKGNWGAGLEKAPVLKTKKKKSKKTSAASKLDTRYILAPMVGASELPFRLLCRRYGTTLAYTPMMDSGRFATEDEYRAQEFQCTPQDRPLVAHFSANDPKTFLQAAKLVEHRCDAIDLNLGCPQRVAAAGHFGSFLLGDADRALVLKMVETVSRGISIPLFVKIRLLNTTDETIQLCKQLRDAGAALIAIHARYRVDLTLRKGPGARDGAAMLDQVKVIKEAVNGIPIIANGNVKTFEDVEANQASTGADGVMSAEGILDNPALFAAAAKRAAPAKLQLAREYLALVQQYPTKLKTVVFHLRRMCLHDLTKFQLLEDLLVAKTLEEAEATMEKAFQFEKDPDTFAYDPDKLKKQKAALERKKHEEGKRKQYEGRMTRKAKREGKPLDFYLKDGLEPPTAATLAKLKEQTKDEAFATWTANFKQHCYAFHFEPLGCKRDRACAFLHFDVAAAARDGENNQMLAFG
jgi:tRNA-dihydrouridine synthase 1